MSAVPIDHVLILAAILFAIGLTGLLARRNLIFMLVSVEVMLNAGGLAFVAAGSRWNQADGQVMFLFILTMAAAEVALFPVDGDDGHAVLRAMSRSVAKRTRRRWHERAIAAEALPRCARRPRRGPSSS